VPPLARDIAHKRAYPLRLQGIRSRKRRVVGIRSPALAILARADYPLRPAEVWTQQASEAFRRDNPCAPPDLRADSVEFRTDQFIDQGRQAIAIPRKHAQLRQLRQGE
jgi:hypothetical protein